MSLDPRRRSFFDPWAQGLARVAVAVPRVALADPAGNVQRTAELAQRAAARGAGLVLFPELGLSGYSLDDLHPQDALLGAVLDGLAELARATAGLPLALVVGAPLRARGRLFNVALVLKGGEVLGAVPKSYLPGYREFYEKRQFAAARDATFDEVEVLGSTVPFGADLIFRCLDVPDLLLHVEICEDVWVPVPPSTWGALGGATVLANLSASNITIGKASYRHQLARGQSARTLSAYLYAGAGDGESTTDLAWDGLGLIYENGTLLGETQRFAGEEQLLLADVDLSRLVQDRSRMTSWIDSASDHAARLRRLREVPFRLAPEPAQLPLRRPLPRFPYVPSDPATRDERCQEVYRIQVSALAQRLRASGISKAVIGVSGGLDSTHALIVAARAMDRLQLPRSNVLAYTMPGYATSAGTRRNALRLMQALGVSAGEIDIRPSCDRMLADIGHPAAAGEKLYDATYENVQAGERTSHLFRLANRHGGLVVGTGDLSELALGWCTYGVGDQMSHYNPNASVPKTLVRHLVAWEAERAELGAEASAVLGDILATEISPELVPGDDDGAPAQRTEELIGPYELHDFFLYFTTRFGLSPTRVAFLAACAWSREVPGAVPEGAHPLEEILHWLEVFLRRFFGTSQFKRSALPNGPKVGSGGSLSPRGDWRAPSDGSPAPWLADLAKARDWLATSPAPAR